MIKSTANQKGEQVKLISFNHDHLESAFRLSQEMSWMHRYEDWKVALELGHGFVLEEAGSVIGTALWWPYGDDHASMGMIIVAKAAQGRGFGARLMDALLDSAKSRIVTLNATAEGLALYKRRGFTEIGIIHQHQGIPKLRHEGSPLAPVRAMVDADAAVVEQLDYEATGLYRPLLLRRLAQTGEGFVLLRDGIPRGFAFSRLFGRGHVIGPVVADNLSDGRTLIEAALVKLGQTFVRVDTSVTTQLGPWLEEIGLKQVGDNTTMVLGQKTPPRGPACMFALAAQSFN